MRTKQEMEAEIQRLKPFNHNVSLPHGLQTAPLEEAQDDSTFDRVATLADHAFPALLEVCGGSLKGMRVLDLACASGGFSVEASRLGADYVLGIDRVARYIEQSEFIKTSLNLENVEFKKLDVDDLDADDVGHFDVTFCFGILYHLENPVLSMRKISAVTNRIMLVDTATIVTASENKALWAMNTPSVSTSIDEPHAKTSLWRDQPYCQFRPNARAVRKLLRFLGFDKVERLQPRKDNAREGYHEGTRTTFLAIRSMS